MTKKQTAIVSLIAATISFLGALYACDPETTERIALTSTGVVASLFALYEVFKK